MRLFPIPSTAATIAVGVASASFATTLATGVTYLFVSTTNCYVKQGTGAQTAANTDMLVPAGEQIILLGDHGDTVAVIRDTADGRASLTAAKVI